MFFEDILEVIPCVPVTLGWKMPGKNFEALSQVSEFRLNQAEAVDVGKGDLHRQQETTQGMQKHPGDAAQQGE